MPTELIREYFLDREELKKIQMRIVLQAAPFMKGLKASALIIVPEHLLKETSYLLNMLSVSQVCLYRNKRKTVLFLYHEEMLPKLLNKREHMEFLRRYGYGCSDKKKMLKRLASRMAAYYCGQAKFPHEIGIFLGYPLKDIQGFIEHGGKNYLLSGYWKVYDNVEQTRELFETYDKARERAVYQLLCGMSLREIAQAA